MEEKAIRDELIEIQKRIKDLKKDFFEKKKVKEEFFTAGEEFSEQINSLYEDVKKIEQENNLDVVNKELEENKAHYDEIKDKYESLKKDFENMIKSKPKKKASSKEKSTDKTHRISPEKAQKQLQALELQVQTQVLSLDKEAEVARQITELKEIAQSQQKKEVREDNDDANEDPNFKAVKKEYYDLRKKYNNIEKKIRSLYKQIRLISREKKQRYKEIDNLRDQKKEAFESFRVHKKSYIELGKELKDLFKKEEEMLSQLGEDAPVKKKRTNYRANNSKNEKQVEDMLMKKGATLTTEDLLALQKR